MVIYAPVRGVRTWAAEPACWAWPQPANRVTGVARLAAFHQHRCAMCGVAAVHLTEDHDHRTGFTRGLLCGPCNAVEGRPGPRAASLVAGYRKRHPAAIVGYRQKYATGLVNAVLAARTRALNSHGVSPERVERALLTVHRATEWEPDEARSVLRPLVSMTRAEWGKAVAVMADPQPQELVAVRLVAVSVRLDVLADAAESCESVQVEEAATAVLTLLDARRESGNDT